MEKVECIECKTLILPATAEKNNGLCMPCKKLLDTPPKAPPAKIAFYIAAAVLISNALVTAFLMINAEKLTPFAVSVLVDLVLAIFLIKEDERVRYFVVVRAVLGLVIFSVLNIVQSSGAIFVELLVAQSALSGSLIFLLAWETVNWRLITGIALSFVFIVYLLLVSYINFFAQNA